mmetsp:Transcript_62929/g.187589  ORF Transcript_62929/g.187589 Transcript_62929/m.187589 type:complete len:200 (-) Transcript_62929:1009-1608(-)
MRRPLELQRPASAWQQGHLWNGACHPCIDAMCSLHVVDTRRSTAPSACSSPQQEFLKAAGHNQQQCEHSETHAEAEELRFHGVRGAVEDGLNRGLSGPAQDPCCAEEQCETYRARCGHSPVRSFRRVRRIGSAWRARLGHQRPDLERRDGSHHLEATLEEQEPAVKSQLPGGGNHEAEEQARAQHRTHDQNRSVASQHR